MLRRIASSARRKGALNAGALEQRLEGCDSAMDASPQFEALVPQPLDAEGIERRRDLEDIHEELILSILALEEEWQLDNRIAYSLRQGKAA